MGSITGFCVPGEDQSSLPKHKSRHNEASDDKSIENEAKESLLDKNKVSVHSDSEKDEFENDEEEKQDFEIKKTLVLPGECLIEQTFDLEKDLKSLQIKYGNKYKSLLNRNLIKISSNNLNDEYIENNSFKIMQFNMLADGLSEAYRWVLTEKTFIGVNQECLQWTYRGIKLVEEILRFSPDIIALQECDQIDFLMKYLSKKGYSSYFQPKSTSPIRHVLKDICNERNIHHESIKMNNDGVAIIYKRNKFNILNEDDIQYIDMKNNKEKTFGLAVPFEYKKNKNMKFLLIVTHLKSTKTEQGEEKRVKQINLLFHELIKNKLNLPMILCCDLNANPIKNQKGYEALCYRSITDENNLGLKSVYKLANGTEPEYTTWKLREHGTDKHVLDYIFIKNGNWTITEILDIPKASDKLQALIPNWHYPSDHFSIMAQLTWKS